MRYHIFSTNWGCYNEQTNIPSVLSLEAAVTLPINYWLWLEKATFLWKHDSIHFSRHGNSKRYSYIFMPFSMPRAYWLFPCFDSSLTSRPKTSHAICIFSRFCWSAPTCSCCVFPNGREFPLIFVPPNLRIFSQQPISCFTSPAVWSIVP